MSFPTKIIFTRDGCEAELQKIVKENKIDTGIYKYTVAKVFLGMEINFTMADIERLIKNEIINGTF